MNFRLCLKHFQSASKGGKVKDILDPTNKAIGRLTANCTVPIFVEEGSMNTKYIIFQTFNEKHWIFWLKWHSDTLSFICPSRKVLSTHYYFCTKKILSHKLKEYVLVFSIRKIPIIDILGRRLKSWIHNERILVWKFILRSICIENSETDYRIVIEKSKYCSFLARRELEELNLEEIFEI